MKTNLRERLTRYLSFIRPKVDHLFESRIEDPPRKRDGSSQGAIPL